MGDIFTRRPLYLQLRDVLADRIVKRQWKIGAPLPNELALAQEFQVSVGTIRKAIDQLVSEKLVTRHQGRGTFVVDRSSHEFHEKLDRIRDATGGSIGWEFTDESLTRGPATDLERQKLKIDAGEVVRIARTKVTATRRTLTYERAHLPGTRFPGMEQLTPNGSGILHLASEFNILLGKVAECVVAVAADDKLAGTLGVEVGRPLLKLDRIVCDIEGLPVEWREAWCHLPQEIYLNNIA